MVNVFNQQLIRHYAYQRQLVMCSNIFADSWIRRRFMTFPISFVLFHGRWYWNKVSSAIFSNILGCDKENSSTTCVHKPFILFCLFCILYRDHARLCKICSAIFLLKSIEAKGNNCFFRFGVKRGAGVAVIYSTRCSAGPKRGGGWLRHRGGSLIEYIYIAILHGTVWRWRL